MQASADAVGRRGRWGFALLGLGATGPVVLVLLLVVANVQGAAAPLSSVLGLLSFADPDGSLEPVVAQAREAVRSGASTPAVEVLREDFVRYHAVMAALGVAVALGLVVIAVVLWRRRRGTPQARRSWRRVLAAGLLGLLLLAAAFALVAAANVSTALRPEDALIGFLEGGA